MESKKIKKETLEQGYILYMTHEATKTIAHYEVESNIVLDPETLKRVSKDMGVNEVSRLDVEIEKALCQNNQYVIFRREIDLMLEIIKRNPSSKEENMPKLLELFSKKIDLYWKIRDENGLGIKYH